MLIAVNFDSTLRAGSFRPASEGRFIHASSLSPGPRQSRSPLLRITNSPSRRMVCGGQLSRRRLET